MLSPHAEKWGDRSTPVTAHAIQYVCLSDDVEWNVYLILYIHPEYSVAT